MGLNIIQKVLDDNKDILRVVELGTGHGGAGLFFGSVISPRGGRSLTIDRTHLMDGGYEAWKLVAQKYNVEFYNGDVFNDGTIKNVSNFIKDHRALVFCDDGDKKREVALYAEILKKDDLLMAHDYNDEFSFKDLTEKTLSILKPYKQELFSQPTKMLSMMRK